MWFFFLLLVGYVLHLRGRIDDLEQKVNQLAGTTKLNDVTQTPKEVFVKDSTPAETKAVPEISPVALSAKEETISDRPEEFVPTQEVHAETPSVAPEPAPEPYVAPEPKGPTAFDHFVEWVKEDFLVKLGGFLLLLAAGWFVSFAISKDWIGEFGRIMLGIGAGIGVLALGQWRMSQYRNQGGTFMIIGSAMVLLSIWAGRELYDLFDPLIALIAVFATATYVTYVSVKHDSVNLAVSGLVLAMIAPFFVASPEPSYVGFFSYILVVTLGTLWVVYLTGWRMMTPVALGFVLLYSIGSFVGGVEAESLNFAILFSIIFTGVFFVANLVSMLLAAKTLERPHVWTALGNGMYTILWVLTIVEEPMQTAFFVFWTLVFAGGAYAVFSRTPYREPFYVYTATSAILLAAATANVYTGGSLVIAYTLEIATLALASLHIFKTRTALLWSLGLFTVPILLSFETIADYNDVPGILYKDFIVLAVLAATLLGFGVYLRVRELFSNEDTSLAQGMAPILTLTGTAYVYAVSGLETSGSVQGILYTILTLTIILVGTWLYRALDTVTKIAFFYAIPVAYSIDIAGSYTHSDKLFHLDFVALLIVGAGAALLGVLYDNMGERKGASLRAGTAFYAIASVYAIVIAIIELSGPALVATLATEVAVIFVLARLYRHTEASLVSTSALFLVPAIASSELFFSPAWNEGFLHKDFFALLYLTAIFFGAALLSYSTSRDITKEQGAVLTLASAGVIYALTLMWLVFHSVLNDDVATGISLVIYTVLGLGAYLRGRVHDIQILRWGGGILIGFVVARLLFVEIGEMEQLGRIVTFFVIGILLMATAFLGRKKVE